MPSSDAPEFYDKLMHKLEDALRPTEQFAAYQACFGMEVVNQSIPKEQTHRFKAREKSDSLMQVLESPPPPLNTYGSREVGVLTPHVRARAGRAGA